MLNYCKGAFALFLCGRKRKVGVKRGPLMYIGFCAGKGSEMGPLPIVVITFVFSLAISFQPSGHVSS